MNAEAFSELLGLKPNLRRVRGVRQIHQVKGAFAPGEIGIKYFFKACAVEQVSAPNLVQEDDEDDDQSYIESC